MVPGTGLENNIKKFGEALSFSELGFCWFSRYCLVPQLWLVATNTWDLSSAQGSFNVAKSCPIFCDPNGLHHTSLLCPSLSPGFYSNSCPLSQWCYLTISSSATPYSFCLQVLIGWPKDWSFSISSSNEYSGLSSFKIDWFDLLEAQETLKSLL